MTDYPPKYDFTTQTVKKKETPKKFGNLVIKKMKCTPYDKWQKDGDVTHCKCGTEYKFFGAHRHHCRMCGIIFCVKCCGKWYPNNIVRSDYNTNKLSHNDLIKMWGLNGAGTTRWERVCKGCEKELSNELETLYTKEEAKDIMRMARYQYEIINHRTPKFE